MLKPHHFCARGIEVAWFCAALVSGLGFLKGFGVRVYGGLRFEEFRVEGFRRLGFRG